MNEFLQNLRNQTAAKERRYNKTQKPGYEGPNQSPPHHSERKGGPRPNTVPAGSRHDNHPRHDNQLLQAAIEALVETQRERIFTAERLADAEERKADAIERLADDFERLLEYLANSYEVASGANYSDERGGGLQGPVDVDDEVRKTSKKYILKFIAKLRNENMTYEEIAKYLTENNYPTFSGRGRWHAQTIHRLCKDNR